MKRFYSLILLIALVCFTGNAWAEQLNEGFEGTDFAPEGWTTIHVSGSESWTRYAGTYSNYGYNSLSCAQMKWASSGHENYLITPALVPADAESLTFYVKKQYSGTNLIVEVSTTTKEASAFTELQTITDGEITTSWAQKIVDVSAYVGQPIYIAFHVVDKNGSTIWIDDVAGVTIKAETCPKTNAPEASSIGTTSATITWTANGTEEEWNLRYKKSSDSEWTEVKGLKTKSYDLTGLTPGKTSYDYEVQAVCGSEDKSDWKAGVAFQTECATETLPYKPTFSNGVKPGCWDIADDAWGSGWAGKWYTYSVSTGNYGLQYYINSNSASAVAITTPSIEITEPAILAFSYTNYYYGRKVTSTVTISDGETSKVLSLKDATSTSLVDTIIDLSNVDGTDFTNKTITVAFAGSKSSSNSASYLKIANISVERKPCPVPGVPEYSNVTTTSATLTWAKAEDVEDYVFSCVRKGLNPVWGTAQQKLTVTIDTLKQNTEYDFYVRTFCSVGDSSEVKSVSFQTENACSAPTITSTTVTYDGATFEWSGDGDNYQYAVTETNAAPESWTDIAAKTVTITNHASGVKRYFHVRANCGAESKSDEASAEFTPLCPAPTALDTVNETLSTHSVSIHWTAAEGITTYQYVALPSTSALDWSDAKTTTNTSVELTGLASGTTYKAYVRSYYSEYSQSTSISKEFDTECEAQAIGWSANFEGDKIPNCWNASSQWTLYTYSGHNSDHSMRFNASGDGDLVLPSITLNDAALLTFWHQSYYVSCSVYIGETKLGEFAKTSSDWKKDSVDLSAYKGQTVSIIIRGLSYGSGYYLYLDDVAVSYKPVVTPTNVKATQGNASATITWDSEETGTWSIQYRAVGAEAWTTVEGLTEKSITLTGLTNGTEYEAQVQAVCSANRQSAWTASVNFTPEDCPTVTSIGHSDATYNSIYVYWATSGEGTWDLDYKISGDAGWTERHGLTNKYLTLENLETGVEYTVQVSPSCSETVKSTTFTLAYSEPVAAEAENITDESATVQWIGVTDNDTYEYDFVIPGDDADWKETKALTATATNLAPATNYLFVVRSKYPTGVSGNDTTEFATIKVAPKSLAVSEITTNSAKLSWAKDGATTAFEYAVGNDPKELAWNALDAGTLQYTLTELTANTSYTFYVRTKYSADLKSDSVFVSFRTECEPIATLPWEEGFEDYVTGSTTSAAPACWAQLNVNDGSRPYAYVAAKADWKKTGSKSLYIESSGSRDGYVILPEFDAALNTLQISFWHKEESDSKSAILTLGYLTDIADAATFVAIKEFGRATSWTEEKEISLASVPADVRLAFKLGKATDNWYTGIDDITVSVLPSCTKPVLAAPVILPDGATLSWTAGHGETRFQYHVDENDWTLLDENVFNVTLHGYAQNENHDFYVRAYCSSEDQSEEVHTTFAALCPAPTALDTVNETLSTNSVSIHWTAAEGITDYQYVVLAKGATENWTNAIKVEGATTANIEGLDASTAYDVYVRSYFSETVQSASVKVTFRTACAAISALPWTEGFESFETGTYADSKLVCWDELNAVHSSSYSYPQMYVSDNTSYVHSGSKSLYFVSSSSTYVYAILPEFNGSYDGLQLTFWHKEESATSSGHFTLGYMTDPADASTFTAITQSEYTRATSWSKETEDLSSTPEGARLAFRYGGASNNYYAGIDDITIETKPSCAVPTGLAVSEIKDVTAKVAWTSDAENFALQYKASGDDNWTDAAGEIANPFTLTGLTEHTTYHVRVQAVCGVSSESAWTEPAEFTTDWTPKAFPYEESFSSAFDGRWSVIKTHGTYGWSIASEGTEETNYFAQYQTTNNSYNHSILQTPEVVLPNDVEPALLFNWKNGGAPVTLQISVDRVDTVNLDADFNTELSAATDGWVLKKFDLSDYKNHTIRLFFRANSGTANQYVGLDQVRFIEKPCFLPTELAATGIDNGATVTWTAGWDETAWNLRYRVVKDEEPYNSWNVVENILTNETQINGLTANVLHEVQVQAACNGDEWTGSVQFTPTKATGIDNIDADGKGAIKLIENDQLVIIRDGIKYNAQGKRLGE